MIHLNIHPKEDLQKQLKKKKRMKKKMKKMKKMKIFLLKVYNALNVENCLQQKEILKGMFLHIVD